MQSEWNLIKQICGAHIGNLEQHSKIQQAVLRIEQELNAHWALLTKEKTKDNKEQKP